MPCAIQRRPDAELTAGEDHEIRRLLLACFPYETALLGRRYIHEPPAQRWLARDAASGELIAHVAMHDKRIAVGGLELRIGGIAEVCVASSHRGQGLARAALAEAHAWMRREGIPFAMLFGNPRVYGSSGYRVVEAPVTARDTLIEHLNPFKGRPMVCPVLDQEWPPGAIDLRGPKF